MARETSIRRAPPLPSEVQTIGKPPPSGTLRDKLRTRTVDDIVEAYRAGHISAWQRDQYLRIKADTEVSDVLDAQGFWAAWWDLTVREAQTRWEAIKSGLKQSQETRGPKSEQATTQLRSALSAFGDGIAMAFAWLTSLEDVTREKVERVALRRGASPGLARIFGAVAVLGVDFAPVGKASQLFVKGGRALTKAEEARATQRAADIEAAQAPIAEGREEAAELRMLWEMSEAAKRDGVKGVQEALGLERATDEIAIQVPEVVVGQADEFTRQFQQNLRRFRQEMKEITETQTHKMVQARATQLGLTIDDLRTIVPGQPLDEFEILAYLNALDSSVDELTRLADQARTLGTPEAIRAWLGPLSEFMQFSPTFRRAQVQAGRTVDIQKEKPAMKRITDMLMGFDAEAVARGDVDGAGLTMAENWMAFADEPDKLKALAVASQTAWQRFGDKAWPMMREFYTNLLVMRPITHARNFTGNAFAATNAIFDRAFAGVFGLGEKDGLIWNEAYYLSKGMMFAIGDGLRAWGRIYKTLDPQELTRLDFPTGAIPGVTGKAIRFLGLDTLVGMDAFFKTILRRGSYYASAARDGVHQGLRGQKLADFIVRRVNHPTEKMMIEAEDFALRNTFQNDLGAIGKKVQQLGQTGPMVLWFPFMKTPINLAKYSWNRTPGLQLLSKQLFDEIKAGGPKADLAIGRLTTANLMGIFLFEMAKDGFITGSGPVNPDMRRVWLLENEPYSIKLTALGFKGEHGKDWVRITDFLPLRDAEPGTTIFGMIGDFASIMNQLSDPEAEQAAMAITFSVFHNIADKTYWRTVGDIADITASLAHGSEVKERLRNVIVGPAVTVTTGGPLIGGIAQVVDPIRRETRTVLDNLIARVPGWSKTLPPYRDPLGEIVLRPQAIGPEWLGLASPLRLRSIEEDKVASELNKLKVRLPDLEWKISSGRLPGRTTLEEPLPEDRVSVELTPQERERRIQLYQVALRHPETGMEAMVLGDPNEPGISRAVQLQREAYRSGTRAQKAQMLKTLRNHYWDVSKERFLMEDLSIALREGRTSVQERIMNAEATRQEAFVPTPELPQFRKHFERQKGLLESLSPQELENILRYGTLEEDPFPIPEVDEMERDRP